MDSEIVRPVGIVMNSRMQPAYMLTSLEEGEPEVKCILCFTHPLLASQYIAHACNNDVPKGTCVKWHESQQDLLTSLKMLEPILATREIRHLLLDMVPNEGGEWMTILELIEALEQEAHAANFAALN